jgi:hypothetical protein
MAFVPVISFSNECTGHYKDNQSKKYLLGSICRANERHGKYMSSFGKKTGRKKELARPKRR